MDKLFFGAGETVSRNFFLFVLGVVKSISANGKNCTLLNDGGSHVQGSDVEECCCFTRVLASAAKITAALCEQASPQPAMQVQCAVTTSPLDLQHIHTFKGEAESVFTVAVKRYLWLPSIKVTRMPLTHPFTKKL